MSHGNYRLGVGLPVEPAGPDPGGLELRVHPLQGGQEALQELLLAQAEVLVRWIQVVAAVDQVVAAVVLRTRRSWCAPPGRGRGTRPSACSSSRRPGSAAGERQGHHHGPEGAQLAHLPQVVRRQLGGQSGQETGGAGGDHGVELLRRLGLANRPGDDPPFPAFPLLQGGDRGTQEHPHPFPLNVRPPGHPRTPGNLPRSSRGGSCGP